ncbi:MAG: peroxide stress protein YaaA [Bacteroidota bacterium]
MIILLSPSKTLSENPDLITKEYSIPEFLDRSAVLVEKLREFSPSEMGKIMDVNPKLSEINIERYLKWKLPFDTTNSDRALLMFKGEVFNGLKAENLNEADLLYAQDHLRILSGLYGILKPLDLMQPYRLEMATRLEFDHWKNLYDFWGDLITEKINKEMESQKEKVLLNLASDEYYKSVDESKINARILKCQFKEERDGKLKFITIYGKKARGLMTRFIIQNKIDNTNDLKGFDLGGYHYNDEHSTDDTWMFSRLSE